MREATQEESNGAKEYIESISIPTGLILSYDAKLFWHMSFEQLQFEADRQGYILVKKPENTD